MNSPKRMSLAQLQAFVGVTEGELEEIVAELNRIVPASIRAKYGQDADTTTTQAMANALEQFFDEHGSPVRLGDGRPCGFCGRRTAPCAKS